MTDRIDELVTMLQQDSPFRDGTPSYKSWRNERDNAAIELATIAREKIHCGGVIERTSGECLTLMEAQNAAFDAEARAREAEAEADRWRKCGIHESCSDCHHENSDDERDERTCIQAMHQEFHALQAESDKWRKEARSLSRRLAELSREAALTAYRKERGL